MLERMARKRPRDPNALAKAIVDEATGEAEPQREAPKKGQDAVRRGKARAAKLSPERRREIARVAARSRWDRKG
jgi:hypothetical protein